MPSHLGRVLIVAGSDPSGGAGIQADIKTVTALSGYAEAAITALTAQNTEGVFGIHDVPADFVHQQITLVLSDIGADAIKTGMLHSAAVIEAVASAIAPHTASVPYVLDPVMFAKGGSALLQKDALDALIKKLLPLAAVITPNIPEAEFLADMNIRSVEDMKTAAGKILQLGCRAVLLKGGHLKGDTVTDVLLDENGPAVFSDARIATRHTHGTGCTLASAVATGLAQGMALEGAVRRARAFVRKAMEEAPGFGRGHGPLGHHKTFRPFTD